VISTGFALAGSLLLACWIGMHAALASLPAYSKDEPSGLVDANPNILSAARQFVPA